MPFKFILICIRAIRLLYKFKSLPLAQPIDCGIFQKSRIMKFLNPQPRNMGATAKTCALIFIVLFAVYTNAIQKEKF